MIYHSSSWRCVGYFNRVLSTAQPISGVKPDNTGTFFVKHLEKRETFYSFVAIELATLPDDQRTRASLLFCKRYELL